MSKRGYKDCPNCNTELAARRELCQCGYHFPSKEVRLDLLEEKKKVVKKEPKIYTEGGPGRKLCPECNIYIAAVSKKCPKCEYEFPKKVKKVHKVAPIKKVVHEIVKKEEPKKAVLSETQKILVREANKEEFDHEYEEPCKTPDEHAERILSYGVARASMLLNVHKWSSTWSHVNWKLVEEKLLTK